jgi:hypothetical protein
MHPNSPLKFGALSLTLAAALRLLAGTVCAGSYSQSFTLPDGTMAIGGGATLSTTSAVATTASVQGGALRLVQAGVYNTVTAFKLPDLDPGNTIQSFDVSFKVRMTQNGTEIPADGFSFNFGPIPLGEGGGPLGFAMREGLVVGWDTYNNGNDPPSIETFYDGISISNAVRTFTYSTAFVPVTIHWDRTGGLDVSYNGVIVNDLAIPAGFPKSGYQFAFSAYAGGLSQDVYIDDLIITTQPSANVETGGPVISEFVADNTLREDAETDTPDWIEIYNGQNTSASLDGWFLTDDATNLSKWRIPAVTMPAYGYLVISASGKNRTTVGDLHTNFKLANDGGYLALVRPAGTVASSYDYLAQAKDVAFGELGGARTRGYPSRPTPGGANEAPQAANPPAEDVVWSRDGGLITGATPVSITVPAGATVRYTTNGTVPTETSTVYATPFNVTSSQTLRAKVFRPDALPGSVSSRTFLLLDSSLTNFNGAGQPPFSSNLPVVVLDSFGTSVDSFTDPGSARPFRLSYAVVIGKDPGTGRASITATPDFQGRSGVHVRGESSSGFPQKSYAWETWDNEGNDKDVSILGLPSDSDWVLHGPWSDKTLMRNYLVYSTFGEAASGYFAPRTRFVEVFFNQEAGQPVSYADYRGIYLLVEKPKQGPNRVDIAKTNSLVTDPALVEGGYVFKHDKNAPGSTQWNTATNNNFLEGHDPEALNTQQFNYLRGYVNNMEAALAGGNFTNPATGYQAFLDRSTFIDGQWAVEIAKQVDGYVFSTYFNKDRGGKVKAGPLWDFNISLGNADYATGDTPTGWLYDTAGTATGTGGLWYPRLHQDADYRQLHFDRFWQLRRGIWSTAAITTRIDSTAAMLADGNATTITNATSSTVQTPLARHYRKYQILGTRQWPNPASSTSQTTFQSEINAMKTWIITRLAWLDDQFYSGNTVLRPPVFSAPGGIVNTPFDLTISRYAGTPPAGKSYTTGTIYYTLDGSDPRSPSTLAANARTLVTETAPCRVLIPSADIGVTWRDVGFNDTAWLAGTQGVGYDDNPDYDPFIHTNLEAPNPVMKGVNQTVYIRIPFTATAEQLQDVNFLTLKLRRDDGFVAFLNGTKIAEHMQPASLTWNAAATPAAIDEGIAKTLTDFDCTNNLAALHTGENVLAIHGLNFGLTSSDFLIQAVLETGVRTGNPGAPSASAVAYTAPLSLTTSATVKARVYDSATNSWTPITEGSYIVNAVPASAANVVVSEMNYHPADPTPAEIAAGFTAGNDFEYIELQNIGASAVDLTGAAFTAGVGFAFTSALSPSVLRLDPGERVVVAENPAAFAMRYGINSSLKLAGPYSGNLSNSGDTVTLLAADTSVIKSFTYDDEEPWPVDADGNGYSLVLNNPATNPDHNLAVSWRSSAQLGGTPGGANGVSAPASPLADNDGDGLSAIVEHALGLNPSVANGSPVISSREQQFVVNNAPGTYLVVEFQRNLLADGVTIVPELSTSLAPGSWQAGALVYVGTHNNGDGTAKVAWRSSAPVTPSSRMFLRLRVQ